ncbi:MAG: ASKHA domain-containing protein [bacterium]|nr:DUF4445 domain-containing protein [Acidimicrobiia bacterium]MCY4649058.1 ASKHA domain-containing protein [bacterium]
MAEPVELRIIFTPSGRRGRVPRGTTVLEAARMVGADLASLCGGRGICGRCQMTPVFGEFAKHGISVGPEALTEWSETESSYRKRRGLAADRRLGCMAKVLEDVLVDVPPESQTHRQVVRKEVDVGKLRLDPVTTLHYVVVEAPTLEHAPGDAQRLVAALAEQWALTGVAVGAEVLGMLQDAVRAGDGKVTAAVRDRREVVSVWPGFREQVLGVAVDVGSTTIAGHLADLTTGEVIASQGLMNPQVRLGEDLMSRVSYVALNEDGAQRLTSLVRSAVSELCSDLLEQAGADRESVLEMVVVGNPIMHHLFLGLDVRPLGEAPFTLATDGPVEIPASRVGIELNEATRIYLLPCIAGHVGADAAGMILSERPYGADEIMLLCDIGTNAEIVLGNADRLLAASSPTGPALEGAQISSGQRAAPGAIERVRIDPQTLEPRIKVIGVGPWSDEPGFSEQEAEIGVTGICGSGIIEVLSELAAAGVILADGRIDGASSERSPRVVRDGRTYSYILWDKGAVVRITQNDVRAVQLAKAALLAGARLLMDHLGSDQVDRIRLAGAFGSHLSASHSMELGLIPRIETHRATSAGNAAGTGALMCLLSGESRREIELVISGVEKIETAIESRFQEHFVASMSFPGASKGRSDPRRRSSRRNRRRTSSRTEERP